MADQSVTQSGPVSVYRAENSCEARLVCERLLDQGIEARVAGESLGCAFGDGFCGPMNHVEVFVAAADGEAARRQIAQFERRRTSPDQFENLVATLTRQGILFTVLLLIGVCAVLIFTKGDIQQLSLGLLVWAAIGAVYLIERFRRHRKAQQSPRTGKRL